MNLKRGVLILGLLACCALPGQVLGKRVPQPRPSQEGCTIAGVVTNAVTRQPIAGAWVTMQQYGQEASGQFPPSIRFHEVFTDAAGRFEISAAVSAYYELNIGKNGYVAWGAQSNGCPQGPGTPAYRYPPIRLMPAAVISGQVTDGQGHPLSGALVQVVKVLYGDMGTGLGPGNPQKSITDDRGEYRIFGLVPGPYFVVVNYEPGLSPYNVNFPADGPGSSLEFAYPPSVLYPGTREISEAREILLAPGRHVTGIDFRLVAQRTHQVIGTLSGIAEGKGVALPDVRMSVCGNGDANLPLPVGVAGGVGPNGQFLVRNVPAGCYDLMADQRMGPHAGVGPQRKMAYLRLEVRDHDINDLHLTLKRLPDVPLQIVVEGPPLRRDVKEVEVGLRRGDGHIIYAVNGRTGSQVLRQVLPGNYRVTLYGLSLPSDAYLKSALLGTRDILTKSVRILLGEDPGRLTVTLAQDGAELTGTVSTGDGKPDPMASVVLVPAPALRKIFCLYKSATTNPSGRFVIQGIRPGSYTLFAWHGARYRSWLDPLFLKDMEGRGIHLELGREERKTIHLQSIVVTPAEGGLP